MRVIFPVPGSGTAHALPIPSLAVDCREEADVTRKLTVADYMTVAPYSIGLDQSLRAAAERMREHGIRHMPVLEGGVLFGVLTERDIATVQAIDVNLEELTVEEAMTPEPYTVSASTPLSRVARAMAEHKYGCAVVMEKERVKGIFTTTDALQGLADVLEERGAAYESMPPSQARAVILAEHVHVRALLDRAETAARNILSHRPVEPEAVQSLHQAARHLVTALAAHFELENRVLVPVLQEVPGFGAVRAERLLHEHTEQTRQLDTISDALRDPEASPVALAVRVEGFVTLLREDMLIEEATLLDASVLRDDDILEDCATG
jgi:acetoin utilization protein AcuB